MWLASSYVEQTNPGSSVLSVSHVTAGAPEMTAIQMVGLGWIVNCAKSLKALFGQRESRPLGPGPGSRVALAQISAFVSAKYNAVNGQLAGQNAALLYEPTAVPRDQPRAS